MAVFLLNKRNSLVMLISKFVIFLTHDLWKLLNWKKKVNTGYKKESDYSEENTMKTFTSIWAWTEKNVW